MHAQPCPTFCSPTDYSKEPTHWKRPCCWERLRTRGEASNRGWDGWMASPTRWTWVWANSGRSWRSRKPVMLQFIVFQRVRHNLVAEQQSVAHQAPLSMEFSRQEYWSMLPFSYSRRSSWPRDETRVSYISFTGRHVLYNYHHLGSPKCDEQLHKTKARESGRPGWESKIFCL